MRTLDEQLYQWFPTYEWDSKEMGAEGYAEQHPAAHC
jgi:hypothetical protein